MQGRVEKYFKQFKEWIEPLLTESTPELFLNQRLTITFSSNEISFLHLDQIHDVCQVLMADTRPYNEKSLTTILSDLAKRNNLENVPVTWLLGPDDYQLFLIESLPVAKDEFNDALEWRIRSLINYPVEEAVLDHFLLPAKKATPKSPMVAAVSAKQSTLSRLIDTFKNSNLMITDIAIPELAMRTLTAFYENDEKSTGFIYFYPNAAILNITLQKTLYFTRRINFIAPQEATPSAYEKLSLEIMRYFDYFQSQWRHPSPTRIFIAAEHLQTEPIATVLSETLLVSVEPFSLQPILVTQPNLLGLEKKYLLPLGASLQKESKESKEKKETVNAPTRS